MVGSEFIDFIAKYQVTSYVGVEDFADKLNFLFSSTILILCTMIITVKQYLMKPISCYISNLPSGSDFDDYVENFCWVHGTIPLEPNEEVPKGAEWDVLDKTRRINYYQWVPFVLGLQCILFYIPRILWQMFCYNRTGTDLEHLIATANTATRSEPDKKKTLVKHIVATLEDMLFQHRDYRHGRVAHIRRKAFDICSFCVVSKRLGTWLIFAYFFIKCLYIANAVGQIYLMQHFLGFNSSMSSFGVEVARYIVAGKEWSNTLIFPRVTFCNAGNVRHLGTSNRYIAQCALPVNMLNEKIYVFLWFWTVMVASLTTLSLPIWFYRIAVQSNRTQFIKKFLRLSDDFSVRDQPILKKFVREFLRHDGVFLLRMISLNAGDLITTDIVDQLWTIYKEKYRHRDLLDDSKGKDYNMMLKLEPGGQSTATTFRKAPTAPNEKLLGEEDYV